MQKKYPVLVWIDPEERILVELIIERKGMLAKKKGGKTFEISDVVKAADSANCQFPIDLRAADIRRELVKKYRGYPILYVIHTNAHHCEANTSEYISYTVIPMEKESDV